MLHLENNKYQLHLIKDVYFIKEKKKWLFFKYTTVIFRTPYLDDAVNTYKLLEKNTM